MFGHEEGVWSLAFDKLRIISGSLDKTIKVWDTESGECLYTLSGPDRPVTCVGLGGTKVVGDSADGAIFVWDYGARASSKKKMNRQKPPTPTDAPESLPRR
ncbi:hypothetical protein BGX20_008353 [Mortierella sp. AD010]|nr:hypothetical protein BGX20_008353 [Mortierella sp. AD010]